MTRELTAATQAASEAVVTEPGYLIELLFSVPVRISTRGLVSWNSQTWLPMACAVGGLALDGTPLQEGSLTFIDSDGAIAVLVLAEGVADRGARVWEFFGQTPATADPVLRFDGVLDTYAIDDSTAEVHLSLKQAEVLFAPRNLINAANGFNFLPATGTKINWGGQDYELTRGTQ